MVEAVNRPTPAVGDFVVRVRTDGGEPVVPPDMGVVVEVRPNGLAVQWASGASDWVQIRPMRIARIRPIEDAVDRLSRDDLSTRYRWALELWREMVRHIEEDRLSED